MPQPSVRRAELFAGLEQCSLPVSFAGGADIQVVKQRLGHGSLRTTEKYLHFPP